jgi:two-component system cell cycle response regulator DivK
MGIPLISPGRSSTLQAQLPVPVTAPLVLVVDDYDDALDIYEQYLTFKGYRVMTATNGAMAIDIARAHHPAVIFMDLRMPDMTGTEAMRLLRREAVFNHVPIVALTAHALEEEKQDALGAGFDEEIPKPCLPDELLAAIDRLLLRAPRVQL